MTDKPRLIERAFPLKQASLDSVHEKNVRHGHISTLHIWPARRPLAACRAALIATLLPDPGTPEERQKLCEKIGGKVVKRIEKKKMPNGRTVERIKEETEGGILHWKRETENAETLEWFRQEIRKAYGGRAPRVLDPFAGGGAIPLEAMRLGCEVTAVDINPVAWFILKCTLEYPQRLAGRTHPLPDFILEDEEFMADFYKAHPHLVGKTRPTKKQVREFEGDLFLNRGSDSEYAPEADLAWHVRAWGKWVLDRARKELAKFYPTYADFEPLTGRAGVPAGKKTGTEACPTRKQLMRLVPLNDDRTPDIDALNAEFSEEYLADKQNPRWVAKPTVAYLWARTVTCKNCRATVPLLKTRWLCKKDKKRVLLTMEVREVGQASVPASELQLEISHRRLPHWRLEGSTYFVTWRLHPNQTPLTSEERSLVLQAIRHSDGQRYDLVAWVVMDDHVHVIVRPRSGHDLSAITHSWKSFTANQLQRKHARQGSLWQDESWDRIIRDEKEYWEKAQYILNNPLKRWPELKEYAWVGFQGMAGTEACPTRKEVVFGIENDVPVKGGNAAQRREHDKRIGAGTMSRAGVWCPCCQKPGQVIMTMEDIRTEGKAGRLGVIATAVITESQTDKVYRLPTRHEIECAEIAVAEIERVFREIPFGEPIEPTPSEDALGMRIPKYGFNRWCDLFSARQLLVLGTLVKQIRYVATAADLGIPITLREAIASYLVVLLDKTADYNSTVCTWHNSGEKIGHTFARFALPITWDVAELATINDVGGSLLAQLDWVARYIDAGLKALGASPEPAVVRRSATQAGDGRFDAIVTDPPYYDAIPYSDCMDFFYVWIRRIVHRTRLDPAAVFSAEAAPKWDRDAKDGELIDDASRHGGDAAGSRAAYEDGMARAFIACEQSLNDDGRLVIVFAHKHPEAWGTLVSAIIRAGFIVDGSWPIQTEMGTRTRAMSSAALSSSVWLVCKKRPETARPGWDNKVMEEMRANIATQLREFWDAGIRGPDFVWAATGPALEAYSKHPVVKKANDPGKTMEVGEFLSHVRRMVVDFVVGRVLTRESGAGVPACQEPGAEAWPTDRMDAPTAYYLLHRHDFGLEEAPAGACILYATACGLSDRELEATWDILVRTAGTEAYPTGDEETYLDEEDTGTEASATEDEEAGSGSKVKLKTWAQRNHRTMGYEAPGGQPVPLIDRVHRLMHLWRAGDALKVDEYLDEHGLRRQELFRRLLQSLIELSPAGSDERSLLESLSNHIGAKGAEKISPQRAFIFGDNEL